MENESFYLQTNTRGGCDVEAYAHKGAVWLCLDNGNIDRASRAFSAQEARELAAALLKFADEAEGK